MPNEQWRSEEEQEKTGGGQEDGEFAQCSAVSSMQRRQLNATLSARCKDVNAAPSAQCSAVNSMQRRQLNAGPSGPVNSMQGPSVSMQGCLLNAGRSVFSTQKLLKASRHFNAVQGRLLNAGPSAQRNAFLLDARPSARCRAVARPSAQCKDVRFSAGPCVSMQGLLITGPSLQGKAICSTQGRHLNAGAFAWLDQDLLRELSSEKKPTPWCLFFPKKPILGVPCLCSTCHSKTTLAGSTFLFPNSCQKNPPGDTLLIPDFG